MYECMIQYINMNNNAVDHIIIINHKKKQILQGDKTNIIAWLFVQMFLSVGSETYSLKINNNL